ncbi:MAG: extracellular solute-binding protein [Gammaproteobacteria bacterium]|nr:extracellular solute-binding protein [Gammaproteobacteria bacterium]
MTLRAIVSSVLCVLSVAAHADGKVVVYNWAEYIPEGVLEQFTEKTGIKVEYSTYDNNETMYAKLKLQNGKGYDIVVPSTYLVSRMRKEGLIQPIDHARLTNYKHLDPDLLDKPYDPGNQYSIPYLWGSTAIGVNSDDIDPASITGWADLWDEQWRGKLLLIDDMREVFHMAYKINGVSTNTTDPAQIEQAYEKLKTLMPNVLVFNADAPREPFLAGDVSLGMLWSGEASMAQEENAAIEYVYPSEGAGFWIDNFVIPAGAENVENAHKFLDFMLRPEVAKQAVEEIGYATPNLTARDLLDEETRNNPIIFPSADVVKAGEFQEDIGEEANALMNDYWEKLKSGQ